MLKRFFENNPRHFAFLFAGALALMMVCVASLNFIVNPMAQFPTRVFPPMVQESRSQKLKLESEFAQRPDGLILGSSRVMKLEPDYLQSLTGKTFFNAGVNYGKPEDHLAWLGYYQAKYHRWPEIVVIGIDPSSLSSELNMDARLMSTPELAEHINQAISLKDRMSIWTDLLAWDHTKRSVKSLAYQALKKKLPAPVEHYREDGLLVYDIREREIKEGSYDFAGPIHFNQREYLPKYAGFKRLSEKRKATLVEIAAGCKKHGSKLVIFITAMHPEMESYLSARCEYGKRHDQVAEFLGELAQKYGFDFHDLAHVESFGGDPTLFVDGIHPLEPNTRRMLDILFPGKS